MNSRDELYFRHILDAINQINLYLVGATYDNFCADRKSIDAVVRELEIIGEAAKQMSEEGRKQLHPAPWSEMISTRNRLIHEYFGVDLEMVWKTTREDLLPLKNTIEKVLGQM